MTSRRTSTIVGILILTAYLILLGQATDSKPVVFLVDILSGLSVIFAAVLMYPLFKKHAKLPAVGYIVFKAIEGLLMFAAGFFFLADSTQHLRAQIYGGVQTWAFIVSAFIFYYLMYVSKLVPRFISIWGIVAIACLLLTTTLALLNVDISTLQILLILIITNEVFLAVWLMVKGFNKAAIKGN